MATPLTEILALQYLEFLDMNASPLWSGTSAATLLTVGALCRMFLLGTQRNVQVEGLPQFLQFMQERKTRDGGGVGGVGGVVTGEYLIS